MMSSHEKTKWIFLAVLAFVNISVACALSSLADTRLHIHFHAAKDGVSVSMTGPKIADTAVSTLSNGGKPLYVISYGMTHLIFPATVPLGTLSMLLIAEHHAATSTVMLVPGQDAGFISDGFEFSTFHQ